MSRSFLVIAGVFVLVCSPASAVGQVWTAYADIGPTLLGYETTYPTMAKRYDLGLSVQGRNLWAIRISDNVLVEEDEPEFKYIATMHGDEIVGTTMCMMLIDYLLTNYGSDPQATNIIDEVDLWIVPLMNPDGYDRSPRTRYNANGVDLNRDFPEGAPPSPEPNSTAGRAIETQLIMNWVSGESFTLSANFHGGALVANYPFDNDGSGSRYTPDNDVFVYISETYSWLNQPMWNGAWFHGITNGVDWYVVQGGMQDWNYRYMGCNEVTIELSDIKEPSATLIPSFWNDNRDAMMAYIETSLIGVRGVVTHAITGAPIAATVTVVGRDHEIYTDPDVGDYHRMLLPGTYDLVFDATGFNPITVNNVAVSSGTATRLDVQFGPSPPVTQNVSAQVNALDSVNIALLGSDVNNDPLDFVITTLPLHGDLSDPNAGAITAAPYTLLNNSSIVTYTAHDYVGTDGFSFKANDGGTPPWGGDSNTSGVSLTLIAAAPVIATTALPDGTLNAPYGPVQLAVNGGQPPVVWNLITGSDYAEQDLGASQFAVVGAAQSWRADDRTWSYTLPFTFPFYDGNYTVIRICSNGYIDFGTPPGSTWGNSTQLLKDTRMIAVLWDDLKTSNPGGDIFIDESVAGEVTIRWSGVTYSGNYPVNFAVTLTNSGVIRFHYGSGNSPVTPTVGISDGDGVRFTLSAYDAATALTGVNSVEYEAPTSLPMGMTLSAAGQLSGMPTESGSFQPVFEVVDSLARSDQKMIPLYIGIGPTADGDYDGDGNVDLADFAWFQICYGPSPSPACVGAFDFEPDGDVDKDDYSQFPALLTGP